MPVKIRLARRGRKGIPFYHIVVADSRAPRDGKYIENIGVYDPSTKPATIELNFDKALSWVQKGAQPTDTCRSILSKQGVMLKKHLLEGVKKNAFTEADAETRFTKWTEEQQSKITSEKTQISNAKVDDEKKRLDHEIKIREQRAADIAQKLLKAEQAASAAEAEVTEEAPAEEAVAEETAPEASAEEKPAE